jgi:hypothetical protein
MEKQYYVEDFLEYVQGWLGADSVRNNRITIEEMNAALLNATVMLKDSQDGIAHYVERVSPNYNFGSPEDWSMD